MYELELSPTKDFSADVLTFQTRGTEYRPAETLEVSTVPPVGRRYFWRVRACLPRACSEPSTVRWINLGRCSHDYNGDGFADILVGAPENDQAGQGAGRAYVYFGARGAFFDTGADGVIANSATSHGLGESVASAGDYNVDGFADVLIGTVQISGRGSAYLYFGGAGSVFDPTPDATFSQGEDQARFGTTVSSAGDLNGDGFDDLLIGAPGDVVNGDDDGHAYVFFGGTRIQTEPGFTFSFPRDHNFGDRVSLLGDINGDEFSDVAVNDAQPGFAPDGARPDRNTRCAGGRAHWPKQRLFCECVVRSWRPQRRRLRRLRHRCTTTQLLARSSECLLRRKRNRSFAGRHAGCWGGRRLLRICSGSLTWRDFRRS